MKDKRFDNLIDETLRTYDIRDYNVNINADLFKVLYNNLNDVGELHFICDDFSGIQLVLPFHKTINVDTACTNDKCSPNWEEWYNQAASDVKRLESENEELKTALRVLAKLI